MATSGQGVLRRLLVVFEFGADTSKVDAGKKKLDSLFKDMQKVAAAFAGGAIARGVGHFVKDTVDEMMAIRKGAQELKITTDEMQQLRSAARATGMDVQWLHFTLERLEVNVERSTHGAKRQAEAMQLLGIKAHDATGRVYSAKELFLQFAEGFEKITDQNKQARAVWDMMGRGAHRLLPLLRMGKERILELMQATEEYGKYQERDIELATQYSITLEHLRLVWTGIKSFIMSQWLPMLGKQTEGIIKAGKWLHTMMKNSLLAKAALQVLQAAMVGLALKMAFAYPYATALIGGLTLLIGLLDDVEVWWNGGESIIGLILDKLGGKGTSAAAIEALKGAWQGLIDMIEAFGAFIKDHPEVMAGVEAMMKIQGYAFKAFSLPWKLLGKGIGAVGGAYIEHKASELYVPSDADRAKARWESAHKGTPIPGSPAWNGLWTPRDADAGPPQFPMNNLGYGVKSMFAQSDKATEYHLHTTVHFDAKTIAVDEATAHRVVQGAIQDAAANLRREKQANGE